MARVFEEGDAVPDRPGLTFSDLFEFGIGDNGDLVVFECKFDDDKEEGIFAYYQGELINVIDSTQSLDGKSIDFVDMEGEGIDGKQFAFEVNFTDGTDAIYIATIPVDTCTADVNNDGEVTPADFNAWVLAFNNGAPECDQNGDGNCTPADFNAWVLNFNNGC